MTDFEVAIVNAAKSVIGANTVRCCLFHLAQAVYRRVQSEGLKQQYYYYYYYYFLYSARQKCNILFKYMINIYNIYKKKKKSLIHNTK